MLKEHHVAFKWLMIFVDLVIVMVTFFAGFFLRNKFDVSYEDISTCVMVLPTVLVIWGVLLHYFGMYDSFRTRPVVDILLIVAETAFVSVGLFGSFVFVVKIESLGRLHTAYSFLLAAMFLSIEKVLLVLWFRYQRKKGLNTRNMLIVGTGKRTQRFLALINKHAEWGIHVVGLVDEDRDKMNSTIYGHKVIGSFSDMPDIIKKNVVDEVLFIVPRSWLDKIEELMYQCEIEGLRVRLALDFFDLKLSKAKYTYIENFPILTFESAPDQTIFLLLKRLLDIIFSGMALIVLSPVFVVTALLIKITSKGEVFFKQQRCSLYGRRFLVYKFRTMVEDAEAKLKDLLAYNEMDGPVFKMENDPRVTKIGKILRKFSIDELPQLLNVFKGDMSLVGPRPPLPGEVDQYKPWQRRRLSMRPGMTCLWQAYGRNEITDFNEWMKLDLNYIDNWSLWLDFKILLKTIPSVLSGIGAK